MLNAIILAGEQKINNWECTENKALFKINGKMMVEYVIEAVKKVDDIGQIVVVGPAYQLEEHLVGKVDAVIDSKGAILDNVIKGIRFLKSDENVLICSSDIPLITSEAINDFIIRSKSLEAEFCYPVVEKKINDLKYPEMDRTYVKVKEGKFTGGNIFFVNPQAVERQIDLVNKLMDNRKNPLKMARLFGIPFLLGLLTGRISISKIEKRASKVLGIHCKAVICEYPELGHDVDKPSDVIVATAHLTK